MQRQRERERDMSRRRGLRIKHRAGAVKGISSWTSRHWQRLEAAEAQLEERARQAELSEILGVQRYISSRKRQCSNRQCVDKRITDLSLREFAIHPLLLALFPPFPYSAAVMHRELHYLADETSRCLCN